MYNQKQINEIYKQYEDRISNDEDPNQVIKEWWGKIKELGAHQLSCDWKEYGAVVEDYIELLEKHAGATVLDNPEYEGSDQYAWLIFFPAKGTV